MFIYRMITHHKSKIKIPPLVVLIVTMSCICTIVSITKNNYLYLVIITIVQVMAFIYAHKLAPSKAILITIIYNLLISLSSLIILPIMSLLATYHLTLDPHLSFLALNITLNILSVIIAKVLAYPIHTIMESTYHPSHFNILIFIITTLIYLKTFNAILTTKPSLDYILPNYMLYALLITILKESYSNYSELATNNYLLKEMHQNEYTVEKQRLAIHETNNHYQLIKSKLLDGEPKNKVVSYVDSLLDDENTKVKATNINHVAFQYLPPNGIKGFFYRKVNDAESNNIKVHIKVSEQIQNSFLHNLTTKEFNELMNLIGIYLDNAIDASIESEDKQLGIEIYYHDDNINFIFTNTFEGTLNPKIGNQFYTTKGANHGHGLLLAKRIISKSPYLTATHKQQGNLYIQTLTFSNPNSNK